MNPSSELLQAIAVTAELTGTQLSPAAARILAEDLSRYPDQAVIAALSRCRRELKGRLTIAEVMDRIDDGRPGPEEAWAHCSPLLGDESRSIVWTEEEKIAFFACSALENDPIAARMAFVETYRKALAAARADQEPLRHEYCLGFDVNDRETVLLEAVRLGRLQHEKVAGLLPWKEPAPEVLRLIEKVKK